MEWENFKGMKGNCVCLEVYKGIWCGKENLDLVEGFKKKSSANK